MCYKFNKTYQYAAVCRFRSGTYALAALLQSFALTDEQIKELEEILEKSRERGTDGNAPETAGTKMKRLAQGRAADQDEKAFEMVGWDAPQEVKDAWMDAAKEVNANGMGIRGSGMMSHIPQMMVIENKGPSLFLFLTKGRDISHLNGFCYSFNR